MQIGPLFRYEGHERDARRLLLSWNRLTPKRTVLVPGALTELPSKEDQEGDKKQQRRRNSYRPEKHLKSRVDTLSANAQDSWNGGFLASVEGTWSRSGSTRNAKHVRDVGLVEGGEGARSHGQNLQCWVQHDIASGIVADKGYFYRPKWSKVKGGKIRLLGIDIQRLGGA
jgi:hypothetical protein